MFVKTGVLTHKLRYYDEQTFKTICNLSIVVCAFSNLSTILFVFQEKWSGLL